MNNDEILKYYIFLQGIKNKQMDVHYKSLHSHRQGHQLLQRSYSHPVNIAFPKGIKLCLTAFSDWVMGDILRRLLLGRTSDSCIEVYRNAQQSKTWKINRGWLYSVELQESFKFLNNILRLQKLFTLKKQINLLLFSKSTLQSSTDPISINMQYTGNRQITVLIYKFNVK